MTAAIPTGNETFKARFKARLQLPFLVSLIILTVVLIVPEIKNRMSDAATQRWPAIPAQVTKVDLPVSVNLRDPYFEPHIEYKYIFAGKEYTGTRISFAERSPLLGYDMGAFADAHPIGKPVMVRVNPERPEISALEPVTSPADVFSRFIAVAVFCSLLYLSVYPRVTPLTPSEAVKPALGSGPTIEVASAE